MAKVYDCFSFFNELDLLEIRLRLLGEHVDYFVIAEATKTFVASAKPLFFDENKSRFSQWSEKIIHVVVDDMPREDRVRKQDTWQREVYQRNNVMRGLVYAKPEDIIIVSDLDEIPHPDAVSKLRTMDVETPLTLPTYFLNYFMNYLGVKQSFWFYPRATKMAYLQKSSPSMMRCYKISKSQAHVSAKLPIGWHCSYLGGYETVRRKIASYAHNLDIHAIAHNVDEHIEKCIQNGADLFSTNYQEIAFQVVRPDAFLPDVMLEYPQYIAPFSDLSHESQSQGDMLLAEVYETVKNENFWRQVYCVYKSDPVARVLQRIRLFECVHKITRGYDRSLGPKEE